METANTTIDYKNLGSSFEMQVNTIKIRNKRKSKGKYGSKHRLPFTPKKVLKNDVPKIKEHLHVSLWSDMENKVYPKRTVLVSNLLHDREAVMLYSPTGVGKTWLSLAIALIAAGGGKLELLDWANEDPQPVCYIDGEMLEEDIHERIKLLIPSLDLDEDKLRKNFSFISRVSQTDDVEEFLSLELEENQWELLNWVKNNTKQGSHPIVILDNLSNLVELGDDNSAGQMQNFNMMVTKARKSGCSMVIVHHTGKSLGIGPDGIPTWRGSYDMATRLDKTICLLPCQSSLDGYVTFQVLEGKSRKGQRISLSIQFNPMEKKWELFDESSTEDRHQLVKELLEKRCIAKYEDLKDVLERSASSAERYIKQAIECGFFEETDWKKWKQEAKTGQLSRENRIEMGKRHIEKNYLVLVNEAGRGGRYVVESNPFPELESTDF